MSSTNTGNQEIIWKYQTPLDSSTLARQLTGVFSAGCITDLLSRIHQVTTSASISLTPPFSFFVPSVDSDNQTSYLFKVSCRGTPNTSGGVDNITINNVRTSTSSNPTLALGFRFVYSQVTENYGDFELLQRTVDPGQTGVYSVTNYPGIILAGINCTTSPSDQLQYNITFNTDLFADFVDSYYIQTGRNQARYFSAYPLRSGNWTNSKFCLKSYGSVADSFNLSVYIKETDSTAIGLATTEIDLASYTTGRYYLIGYQKVYDYSLPSNNRNINLQVYGDTTGYTSFPTYDISSSYYPVAVVYWTGTSLTSAVTELSEFFAPAEISEQLSGKVSIQSNVSNFTNTVFNNTSGFSDSVGLAISENTDSGTEVISKIQIYPEQHTDLPASQWPINIDLSSRGYSSLNPTQTALLRISPDGAFYTKDLSSITAANELQTRDDLIRLSLRQFKGDLNYEHNLKYAAVASGVQISFNNTSVNSISIPSGNYQYLFTNSALYLSVLYTCNIPQTIIPGGNSFTAYFTTSYLGWCRVPTQTFSTSPFQSSPTLPSGITVTVLDNIDTAGFDLPNRGDYYRVNDCDLSAPGSPALAVFDNTISTSNPNGHWDLCIFSEVVFDGQISPQSGTIVEYQDPTNPLNKYFHIANYTNTLNPLFQAPPENFSASYFGTITKALESIQGLYDNSYHLVKPGEYKVFAVQELIDLIDRCVFPCNGSINSVTNGDVTNPDVRGNLIKLANGTVGDPNQCAVVCVNPKENFDVVSEACDNLICSAYALLRHAYPYVAELSSASSGNFSSIITLIDQVVNSLQQTYSTSGPFHNDYVPPSGLVDLIDEDDSPGFDKSPIAGWWQACQQLANEAQAFVDAARGDPTDWSFVRSQLMLAIDALYTSFENAERIILSVLSCKPLSDVVYTDQSSPYYYRVEYSDPDDGGDGLWHQTTDASGPYMVIPYVETPASYTAVSSSSVGITYKIARNPVIPTSMTITLASPLILKTNIGDTDNPPIPHYINLLAHLDVLPFGASKAVTWTYTVSSQYYPGVEPLEVNYDTGLVTALKRCNDTDYQPTYLVITATSIRSSSMTASIPVQVITQVESITSTPDDLVTINHFSLIQPDSDPAAYIDTSVQVHFTPNDPSDPDNLASLDAPSNTTLTWQLMDYDDPTILYSGSAFTLLADPSNPLGIIRVIAANVSDTIYRANLKITSNDTYLSPEPIILPIMSAPGVITANFDGTYTYNGEVLYSNANPGTVAPSDITEPETYTDSIAMVDYGAPVSGNVDGVVNEQATELAGRTQALNAEIGDISSLLGT